MRKKVRKGDGVFWKEEEVDAPKRTTPVAQS